MHIKGISWIEQHFEKLVAGLFFAALLAVLASQYVGEKATVKVGNKQVATSEVMSELAATAKSSNGKIESNSNPKLDNEDAALRPLAEAGRAMSGAVSPSKELSVPLGPDISINSAAVPNRDSRNASGKTPEFAPIAPRAPSRPVVAASVACIHPVESKSPEIAAILPKQLPFDKASATVEFSFSGVELKDSMTKDPDGDGPLVGMPLALIESGLQILALEVEREQLAPDGTWSGATIVPPMPGRLTLLTQVAKPLEGVAKLKELVESATKQAGLIRRPDFYQIFQGVEWTPPSERVVADADKAKQIASLRAKYKSARDQKTTAEEGRAKLPPPDSQPTPKPRPRDPAPPPGGGGGGGGGTGGGGRGGGGGGSGPQSPPPSTPRGPTPQSIEAQRRAFDNAIRAANEQMDRCIKQLRALGDDVADLTGADANDQQNAMPLKVLDGRLLDDPSVRMWVHDMFVERGVTYRYRARIVFSNPLFMQFAQLAKSQEDLAKPHVIRSEFSEWSDQVEVPAERYYFVTGANTPDNVDRSSGARVELFTFSWGFWRKALARVQPGDRVEGVAKGTPDFTQLARQQLDGAGGAGAGNPNPGAPVPGPGGGGGVGGGSGAGGGGVGGGGRQPPGRGDRHDPAPGAPPGGLDKMPTVPKVDLTITLDDTFIAVSTDPRDAGGGRGMLVTYFRDPSGRVVGRSPEADSQSVQLRRLRESAELGDSAMKPKEAIQGADPVPPPSGRDDRPGRPGGGGGAATPPPSGGGG